MFYRQGRKIAAKRSKPIVDLTAFAKPSILLAEEKRQVLLKKIIERSSLDTSVFNDVSFSLLDNYINYCQQLPETANSYYSSLGGLLDHALNRTEAALELFHQQVIQQQTEVSKEQTLWMYALFSAGMLQAIGKLKLDYNIELFESPTKFLKEWNPLLDSLTNEGMYYHYEFQKESFDERRRRLNLLLAYQLMPKQGFAWIASQPDVLDVWLALLNEDPNGAGVLGAILEYADAIAIQRDINDFLLKHAIEGTPRVNRVGTFIDKTTPESTLEQDKLLGAEFILWLTQALEKGKIHLNKAPLVMIPTGLVMAYETFQLFIREHPEYKNWQLVQKGLMAWGLHRHYVGEPMILKKYAVVLPNSLLSHNASTEKATTISALELIQKQQSGEQRPLQQLSKSGHWESPKTNRSVPSLQSPGFMSRG